MRNPRKTHVRARMLAGTVTAVILIVGLIEPASSSPEGAGPRMRVATGAMGRGAAVGSRGDAAVGDRVPAPTTTADITTVDARPWAGAENAIYAPDPSTIYVAYKRFLRDPYHPGGDIVPAELDVGKSVDGGAHWTVQTIAAKSPEQGDLVEQTVSIGGDGAGTVYVAWYSEPTGAVADSRLRVAKSSDGGDSWTKRAVAIGAGEFKSMKVIDARHVLIASSAGLGSNAQVVMIATADGGAHWSSSKIHAGPGWYLGMDTANSGRVFVSYYCAVATDLCMGRARSANGPWTTEHMAGASGDGNYTGLWDSLDVWKGVVYVAFEDFRPSEGKSIVRVLRSADGGRTWTRSFVDSAFSIGWVTSVQATTNHTTGTTDVFVTYWQEWVGPSKFFGHVRIAHSTDGGATWSVWTVPEDGSVSPYLDLAVPVPTTQFISYQAKDPTSGDAILRVARLTLGA